MLAQLALLTLVAEGVAGVQPHGAALQNADPERAASQILLVHRGDLPFTGH